MNIPGILKNSFLYSFVSFFQKGIQFLLLPIYTYYLTPDDYGVLNVILSIVSLLSVLFLLSLHGAASRFHFLEEYANKKKKLWGAIVVIVILNSATLGTMAILFHTFLIDPLAKGIGFFPLLFIAILTTILNPLYLLYQTYLQTTQDGKRYSINMLVNFLLNVGLILFFVIIEKKGVIGILFANLITAIVFFFYSIIAFLPKIKLSINKTIAKQSLKYSAPLIPHSVSGWIMAMIDRLMLNNLNGTYNTGIYSAGYQIGSSLNAVTSSVTQAYSPWFYQNIQSIEGKNKIFMFAEKFTFLYCVIALILALFSPEICKLMLNAEFFEAYKVIPLVAFGYVYSGVYSFFISTLFLKKTYFVPIVTFTSAFIGVILNIFLIPRLGIIGAGFSCYISFFVSAIMAYILSKRENISFNFFKTIGVSILFFVISMVIYLPLSYEKMWILKICILLSIVYIFIYNNKQLINKFINQIKANN